MPELLAAGYELVRSLWCPGGRLTKSGVLLLGLTDARACPESFLDPVNGPARQRQMAAMG